MIHIFDGATGTMLQKSVLKPGMCPELLNIEAPEAIQNVHRAYVEAGSNIVETNTFGASRIKLNEYNSAWSNPNFEIWLLSHFKKITSSLSKNNTLKELKKEFQNADLGNYSKNDKEIFEKITKDSRLESAIKNCKEIYEEFNCVSSNASKNPCTTVFILVEDLSEYLK